MEEKHIFRLALMTSLIGVLGLSLLSFGYGDVLAREGPYVVIKVIDGDTIDLDSGDRIRLAGINTPEIGTCFASEATAKLASMVLGEEVYIIPDTYPEDSYGRRLAYVYVNGTEVNEIMVAEGYAEVFHAFNRTIAQYDTLSALEAQAKEMNLGVQRSRCQND